MKKMCYRSGFFSVLFVLILFSSCSDKTVTAEKNSINDSDSLKKSERPVLRIMIQKRDDDRVLDFVENDFTEWYIKKTGVDLEIDVIPFGSATVELDKTVASGDFPDIYLNMSVPPATQIIYGESGIFLELNEYIERPESNSRTVFDSSPELLDIITLPNGKVYSLPGVNECYHCTLSQRAWINSKWLKKLDLSMPETTEEFIEVLRQFKESDPNGNGIQDEVPLVSATTRWNTNIDGFLMNPFVFSEQYNNNRYILLNDDKISSAVITDGWREALTFLNRIHKLGLLDESAFSNDHTYMQALAEEGDFNQLGVGIAGSIATFTTIDPHGGRWLDFEILPPLKGPSGQRITPLKIPYNFEYGQLLISGNTEDPERAFSWGDGLYDLETTLRSTYGAEGVEWIWAEDGEIGINGKPAIWKHLEQFGDLTSSHWGQVALNNRTSELRLGQAVTGDGINLEVMLFNETRSKMEPYAQSRDKIIPILTFSSEIADEISILRKTLNSYISEMEVNFILGHADISSEAEWSKYISRLKTLGLNRYIELYQKAYDSHLIKKDNE